MYHHICYLTVSGTGLLDWSTVLDTVRQGQAQLTVLWCAEEETPTASECNSQINTGACYRVMSQSARPHFIPQTSMRTPFHRSPAPCQWLPVDWDWITGVQTSAGLKRGPDFSSDICKHKQGSSPTLLSPWVCSSHRQHVISDSALCLISLLLNTGMHYCSGITYASAMFNLGCEGSTVTVQSMSCF